MITINLQEIDKKNYPDNTQSIKLTNVFGMDKENNVFNICWDYENDEECITLWYVVKHIRNVTINPSIRLLMRYVPNARMDRTKNKEEVFTLKYFADFINSMNFDKVVVVDVHSNVSTALINKCVSYFPEHLIKKTLTEISVVEERGISKEDLVIYFPDDGAKKRYADSFLFDGFTIITGRKKRDWSTHRIVDLTIHDRDGNYLQEGDLYGKTVLMIDDIISYGGTFAHSADKLKFLGADKIYAYATHTENSVLDKENSTLLQKLNDGTVKKLYTTNSIYKGNNKHIQVIGYGFTGFDC